MRYPFIFMCFFLPSALFAQTTLVLALQLDSGDFEQELG